MNVAVIEFLGSNCDHDAEQWSLRAAGVKSRMVWYEERNLKGADLVILPGGFSYGDYLRCGAMAARTPVMEAVIAHAKMGRMILGICNGFQMLCEVGLLPGALLRNQNLKFLCQDVYLRCETVDSPFTSGVGVGKLLRVPIAHGDGNYFADPESLRRLNAENRVAFRYVDPSGALDPEWNVNGSIEAIAGVLSENRRIMGMMPHPERASEELLGCADGALILKSALETMK